MKFEISKETVVGLLRYLQGRPWEEVNDGIIALKNLEPVKECCPNCKKKKLDKDDVSK